MSDARKPAPAPSLLGVLKPYKGMIALLVAASIAASGLSLVIPQLIRHAIDAFATGNFDISGTVFAFLGITLAILLFTWLQSVAQSYASERVARDLREQVSDKISAQSFSFVTRATPGKLLTNLTSDANAVKSFVAQAVVTLVSSLFVIAGAAILMFLIDWQLTLVVLAIVPLIAVVFALIFKRVGAFFKKAQELTDRVNTVITESITGAALVRVLNAQDLEVMKFGEVNRESRSVGLSILALFALMIPTITFIANLAQLAILLMGGHYVITSRMSLGDFAAFSSYLSLLIFPIIVIGFVSNVISAAQASYTRVAEVLGAEDTSPRGTETKDILGYIIADHVSLTLDNKPVLKDVSLHVAAKTRTAVIGPTAAGKSQLLYLLAGLLPPDSGSIDYDGTDIAAYDPATFHRQVGIVFQDSVIFNLSVRENIAFGEEVGEQDFKRALETAELTDFVAGLANGLDTVISERGSSLSGGQKQRIMLARALALNPKVLLLDDFTARVDNETERRILENVAKNYPDLTLVSVTQKIAPVTQYDQIVLLMEGEVLAAGTHEQLLVSSAEYVQIWESQKSTTDHELQA